MKQDGLTGSQLYYLILAADQRRTEIPPHTRTFEAKSLRLARQKLAAELAQKCPWLAADPTLKQAV